MIKVILEIDAENLAELKEKYGSLIDTLITAPENQVQILTTSEVNKMNAVGNVEVAEVVEDSVELSETSLEELNLPLSSLSTLKCNGIQTIGDIVTQDISDVMELFNALENYADLLRRLSLWLAFNQNAVLDKWLFDAETKLVSNKAFS